MNMDNYESEYYKQANHNLLILWRTIAFVLFAAYIIEFIKGNRTLSYIIVFSIITFSPLLLTQILNKKTNYDNKNIKYFSIMGYLLFYTFALFTTVSDIAWVYIIPMASILVVYNDKKLIKYTYGGAVFINLIYIAKRISMGYSSPELITNYEIQIACLILSGVFLYRTMNLNIFANDKVKFEIEKSLRDPLTQSYNRNFIFDYFENITTELTENIGISFILIDVDNFKRLNDTQGHNFGDNVLISLCEAINKNIKPYEDSFLVRMGGDEFAIVTTNFSQQRSIDLMGFIKRDFEQVFGEGNEKVTFSIGIANSIVDNCTSYLDLYKLADNRLYKSKDNGKNRITYN